LVWNERLGDAFTAGYGELVKIAIGDHRRSSATAFPIRADVPREHFFAAFASLCSIPKHRDVRSAGRVAEWLAHSKSGPTHNPDGWLAPFAQNSPEATAVQADLSL
jgi:hypothetical protein